MNMFKWFAAPLLLLISAHAYADEGGTGTPVSLVQAMDLAQKNNPEINAARQSWKVRQFEIGPAATWPNPTFTFQDERFPSDGSSRPAERVSHYRVEQTVPFPGKLSADARMKRHESLIAEATYRAKELEILGEVRIGYYQLNLTDQKIALAEKSVAALKSVLQTAQSRLASGQSTTSDVFMAQMELRKMENMLYEQQQARVLAAVQLNTLLNRPTDTAWGPAITPVVIDLPASLQEFQAMARQTAPLYQSAAHEQNHAGAMLHRNRLEYAPDFNLMFEKEVTGDGLNGRQIGVGISVPMWLRRPIGMSGSSREHVIEAENMSQSMQNMVMKMVHMEFTEATTHLNLLRNYERDILPTAQSNLRVAREQYASGRGDFLRVLEAFRAWIDANNEYQDQLYHYGEHWSLLERWVGSDLMKVKEASDAQ